MLLGELTAHALLGGLAMDHHDMIPKVSPNPATLLLRQLNCSPGETSCGGLGCMPIGGVCCAPQGRARYCDAGEYCMPVSGCCAIGKTCTGTGSCDPGEAPCLDGCMPSGAVCCSSGRGGYCPRGYYCTADEKCRREGSSSGGGGGGGGSFCDAGRVRCDTNFCIPSDGMCCGTGQGRYCKSGYYCLSNGRCCRNGRTCLSGSSGDDTDDEDETTTSTTRVRITAAPTTTSSTPTRPTTTSSRDDDDEDDNDNSDDAGNQDDDGTSEPAPTIDGGNDDGSRFSVPAPSPTSVFDINAAAGLNVPAVCAMVVVAGVMAMLV